MKILQVNFYHRMPGTLPVCSSFFLFGKVPETVSLNIIINAYHVHFKDTRINRIA